ncbi:uncharacterized protein LOC105697399 isoform X1 [Orussus abietinus]|uniref:uncharacterized protein LOC105697399 isoform X1 n=1 Tax=Orussus abietinus TaxID=222816 RepID=UPI000C716026|nr:uncharacterized protein LOC105697399 isoform X1 [Orussus abietinus]
MKNSPEQEGTGAVERSELAPRERNPPVLLFFHSPGRRRLPVVAPFRMVAFLSSAGIQIPLHDSHCVTLGETARRYWDPGSKARNILTFYSFREDSLAGYYIYIFGFPRCLDLLPGRSAEAEHESWIALYLGQESLFVLFLG